MNPSRRILVYGYGNPGRRDDGLGNAFVERVKDYLHKQAGRQKDGISAWIETESNYQLNVEDAELIRNYDEVWFVDASVEEELTDYTVSRIGPEHKPTFTTHAASAAGVLSLCQDLFENCPPCHLVHIKGFDWEFAEGLSEKAALNLERAFNEVFPTIQAAATDDPGQR